MKLAATLVTAIIFVMVSSVYAAETLELAPQNSEGPSLEETVAWIKQKVAKIKGNKALGGTVVYTNIEIDNNCNIQFQQKTQSTSLGEKLYSDSCDGKTLSHVVYDELSAGLHVNFNGYCGHTHYWDMKGHQQTFESKNQMFTIALADPELGGRLVKAFNQVKKICNSLPRTRNKELF